MIGQLEVFAEIARLGNVGRAADALHLTQPAATWRLQALERELGAQLFERTGRGMRLTEAGKVALPYAERAVRASHEMRGAPDALGRFRGTRPDVEVAVRTGHSEEVLQLVLAGEVRVGLVRNLRHPDVAA